MCLGPHNDWSLSSPRWSLSGPEISGPHNDQIVWSLSGPGRCLVLLHRLFIAVGAGEFNHRLLVTLFSRIVRGCCVVCSLLERSWRMCSFWVADAPTPFENVIGFGIVCIEIHVSTFHKKWSKTSPNDPDQNSLMVPETPICTPVEPEQDQNCVLYKHNQPIQQVSLEGNCDFIICLQVKNRGYCKTKWK